MMMFLFHNHVDVVLIENGFQLLSASMSDGLEDLPVQKNFTGSVLRITGLTICHGILGVYDEIRDWDSCEF